MENVHGVDTTKIKPFDRVEVIGCAKDPDERHWGTILGVRVGNVQMDDSTLRGAKRYGGHDGNPVGYWAVATDVVAHSPAAVEEPHVCRPMMPPMPYTDPRLGKVAADINETLRYLWDRTGSEWVAETDGIQLDISAEGDYSGSMHIKFMRGSK